MMNNLKNVSVATVGAIFIGLGTANTGQAAVLLGGQIFSTGEKEIKVDIIGDQGEFTHELFLSLEGKPSTSGQPFILEGGYSEGAELIFGTRVQETGYSFEIGPGSRNPDGLAHANVNFLKFDEDSGTGIARVGFEDQLGGGDGDLNDFKFRVSGGIKPTAAPEPSSAIGTLAFGLLGAGYMLNRKLKKQRSATLNKV